MENRFWTVTYRNRDNDQRITAAVFAADQRQAQEKALEGQALDIAGHCQEVIDTLDVKLATLDEIEDLHTRK